MASNVEIMFMSRWPAESDAVLNLGLHPANER